MHSRYWTFVILKVGYYSMIDINFDFQAEAGGRDSDRYSPTLQEYHRILWSKPLPNGKMFNLSKISGNRLYHKSELGEFSLSSDRAVATFSRWKSMSHIVSRVPIDQLDNFVTLTDTIGGIVIWPSNQIDRQPTINGSRGFNKKITDRLDVTIECVRLYYLGEVSPLYDTFHRYKDFFDLFGNFKDYVEFFLLQDAVSENFTSVKITVPFDSFTSSPIPRSVDEYFVYMEATTSFIEARNKRIADLILT
jgi:hypothetical protein